MKTAIYARYSTDKQTPETIETQVTQCRAYCKRAGLQVTGDPFVDRAKSGTTEGGREAYQELVRLAQAGVYEAICCYKYDRLGRSFVETVRSVYELERYHQVAIHSATEPNDPLVRNILLSVAEDFSRQLGARVSDSMANLTAKGFHAGGNAPYGYVTVRREEPVPHVTFEVDPEQAEIVRRIFQEHIDGLALRKIAVKLNDDGEVAPGGSTWDTSAVRYILRNEVYRGWRIWNKTKKIRKPDGKKTQRARPRDQWVIVPGAHEAIVDDELWEASVGARRQRTQFIAKNGGRKALHSPYLLTGLVQCAECGGNFIVHRSRGTKTAGEYIYYRCGYNQRRGSSVCSNTVKIPQTELEGRVLEVLEKQVLTSRTLQRLVTWMKRQVAEHNKNAGVDAKRLEAQLRRTTKEIQNLVTAVKRSGWSEALQESLREAEDKKATLETNLKQIGSEAVQARSWKPSEREVVDQLKAFREILKEGEPHERRQLMRQQVARIVVETSGEVWMDADPNGLMSGKLHLSFCRRPGSTENAMPSLRFVLRPPRT